MLFTQKFQVHWSSTGAPPPPAPPSFPFLLPETMSSMRSRRMAVWITTKQCTVLIKQSSVVVCYTSLHMHHPSGQEMSSQKSLSTVCTMIAPIIHQTLHHNFVKLTTFQRLAVSTCIVTTRVCRLYICVNVAGPLFNPRRKT